MTPPREYGATVLAGAVAVELDRFDPNTESNMPGLAVGWNEPELTAAVIAVPEVFPPSTNITGTLTICGTAFGDWMTTVAQ